MGGRESFDGKRENGEFPLVRKERLKETDRAVKKLLRCFPKLLIMAALSGLDCLSRNQSKIVKYLWGLTASTSLAVGLSGVLVCPTLLQRLFKIGEKDQGEGDLSHIIILIPERSPVGGSGSLLRAHPLRPVACPLTIHSCGPGIPPVAEMEEELQ